MRIATPSSLLFTAVLALLAGVGLGVIGAQVAPLGWVAGIVAAAVLAWRGTRRARRRRRIARRPFPAEWRAWLEERVPLYARGAARDRARFERDVLFFLDEQRFEAVGGAELDDEFRLAVGAGAALLLHGLPDWEMPGGRTILVYAGTFDDTYDEGTHAAELDGMVHHQGPIILTREAVMRGWDYPEDGDNVVLHELAHLFDFASETADGVPSLLDPASAPAWQRLVRSEMRTASLGKSLLRRYAATNPAELFAVAVENFFERPELLARRHPALFDALVACFRIDPRDPEVVDERA